MFHVSHLQIQPTTMLLSAAYLFHRDRKHYKLDLRRVADKLTACGADWKSLDDSGNFLATQGNFGQYLVLPVPAPTQLSSVLMICGYREAIIPVVWQ
jgi:hypothetical protein